MNQPRFHDDLLELAWLACDGTASEEQLAVLAARLQADPEALQRYVQFMAMHADMQWDYIDKMVLPTDLPPLEKMSPPPIIGTSSYESTPIPLSGGLSSASLEENTLQGGVTPSGNFTSMPQSWLGLSLPSLVFLTLFVVIVGALGAESWLMFRSSEPQVVREQAPVVTPAAYLTSITGADWGGRSSRLQSVGNSVGLGEEVALLEGIAEFRLSNGVYLSVEGPAGLVLNSPESLVLQHGKITVHIPWSAPEFQILAGTCRLNATDAEVGVVVTGDRVDTHVFSGEVLATNVIMSDQETQGSDGDSSNTAPAPRDVFIKEIVSQGRSLSLLTRSSVMKVRRWSKAMPSLFATKLTMAGQLPVSRAYTDGVLASAPIGYWRFESARDGVISSEVSGIGDLNIVGDVRISGLAGNRVVEFKPGSAGCLVSRNGLNELSKSEYSVELWLKPSHVHSGDVLALCATEYEWNVLLLELQGTGNIQPMSSFSRTHPCTLRFTHRDPPNGNYRTGTHSFSSEPYLVRRWQYVVAVKRGEQLEFYIDGKLVAQGKDKTSLTSDLRLVVGRQCLTDNILPFSGQIDELAVYSRALNKDEIKGHYQLIDWTQAEAPPVEPKDI
jgi:hypothetical protein